MKEVDKMMLPKTRQIGAKRYGVKKTAAHKRVGKKDGGVTRHDMEFMPSNLLEGL
jgi:hypothetical protein